MKVSNIFHDFIPLRKQGLDLFSTIADGAFGLADTISGVSTNAYNAHIQQEENQKNREFQALEAEKQRSFQQQQTNQLLEYNSAPAQVQRYQQAGINPATAFSSSAGSAGSAMTAPMGAVPSGSSGISPVQNPLKLLEAFSIHGAYMKAMSEAYKASEEGSMVRPLAESEIKDRLSKIHLTELQSQGHEIANMIASKTGLREKEAIIKNIIAQADLDIAEKAHTEALTNREIEKLVGDVYDNVYKRLQAEIGKNKLKMSEIDLKYHEAEVKESINTMRSQQNVNNATATRNLSESDRLKLQNQIDTFEFDIKKAHRYDYVQTVISEWQKNKDISDAQAEEARRTLKAIEEGRKSAKEIDEFLRWLSNAVGLSASISN